MSNSHEEILASVERIKNSGQFKKYIDFIQFPFYRNMEIDTRISFGFPLTIFIGQNGCGKSSCLHALYGAPENYTPYRFWFDTRVDPVNYYNKRRRRHSFWYGFIDEDGNKKEVLKARIRREGDPNYWETSRPLAWAGMRTRRPRNNRDSPIRKNVVYLDFRAELSAFDKFFYFGSVKYRRSRNKQEFIRKKSESLRKLLSGEKSFINSKTRHLNDPVENFSTKVIEAISFILGRTYTEGKSVFHELFQNEGYSVLFNTSHAQYSEAFAGSGEMAVFRLVTEVLRAPEHSFILLDEPEVSLHPGAQERLRNFLLKQIIQKKHQVVLTTHSPVIAKGMPPEAIKVFYQNPSTGRFFVKEDLTPDEAFYHIEYDQQAKIRILVEDKLAKLILEGVIEEIGEEAPLLFNVQFYPGGESVLKNDYAKIFAKEKDSRNYIFLDGDQKRLDKHYDWQDFPVKELNSENLANKIQETTGQTIRFFTDGSNENQKVELSKGYLDYYLHNVHYLPGNIPEDLIWNVDKALKLLELSYSSPEANQKLKQIVMHPSSKDKFAQLTLLVSSSNSAQEIEAMHKNFIKIWKEEKNEDFIELRTVLKEILKKS